MFSRVTNFFAEAFSPRPSTSTPNLIVPPPSNQLQHNNNQNSNNQTSGRRSFINLVSPITHRRNVENNNPQEHDINATANKKKRSASFKTQFDRLFGEDDGKSQKKEERNPDLRLYPSEKENEGKPRRGEELNNMTREGRTMQGLRKEQRRSSSNFL